MTFEQNEDPLQPGYSFNANFVAGLTPIEKNGIYDFFVDRPEGMKGYIINLTHSGEGVVYQGDEVMNCKPGDFLIFPPGIPHYYGRRPNANRWHHHWIYFRARAMWTNWLSWPEKIGRVGYYRPPPEISDDLEKLFVQIVNTSQSLESYSEILSMNLLENFLIRRMQSISQNKKELKDPRIVLACNYITDILQKQPELTEDNNSFIEQVAQHVFLSSSRISHLFKEHMGVSILTWREDQRIHRARLLLQTTPLSIAQIAQSLGYSDQLYFSRVFKNKIGLSPKKFRQMTFKSWSAKIKKA
ncbi:MAG: arabinose operon transcriptional regulator AraC [Commensalibacter sp.]|nr:arabinose operon transcriptional regulator AraC [Commensalibacter sp.]